jgi:DNA-3-methyladenine glycosylase
MKWTDPVRIDELLSAEILPAKFYARSTVKVAKDLLGKVIVHGTAAGRIVETEAYLGLGDLAAHASRGVTGRTRVIFGPPGRAYVYLIYGMYECLNLVAEPEGTAGCVLIRALEPLCDLEATSRRRATAKSVKDLASGPGKLTRAMAITRADNGADVTGEGPFTVRRLSLKENIEVVTTPRIGITKCADWPLRFFVRGSKFVSR